MTTTIYDAKRMEIVTTGGTITSLDMLSRDDGLFLAGFCYVRGWRPSGPAGDEWQRSALQTIPEGWVAIDEKQSSGNRTMFTVKAKVECGSVTRANVSRSACGGDPLD